MMLVRLAHHDFDWFDWTVVRGKEKNRGGGGLRGLIKR